MHKGAIMKGIYIIFWILLEKKNIHINLVAYVIRPGLWMSHWISGFGQKGSKIIMSYFGLNHVGIKIMLWKMLFLICSDNAKKTIEISMNVELSYVDNHPFRENSILFVPVLFFWFSVLSSLLLICFSLTCYQWILWNLVLL